MKKWIFMVLLMSLPMAATAESLRYRFDVRLGLGKIGEMVVQAENTGEAYSTQGVLYTTGLVGAIYDARYESYAEGRVGADSALKPVRYTSKSIEKDDISTTEMTYSGTRVALVNGKAPSHTLNDTIDPMTLIYKLIRPIHSDDVCRGSVDFFDGREAMSVSYTNVKRYNNGRVECDITYSGKTSTGGVSPSAVVFKPVANGMMEIVRFTARTSIGSLSVTRK